MSIPERVWVRFDKDDNKWKFITDEFARPILCECCPCPATCRELAWAVAKIIDGNQGVPNVYWVDISDGSASQGVECWLSTEQILGTVNITLDAPSPVCETPEEVTITTSMTFGTLPLGGQMLAASDGGGGVCQITENQVILPYYSGENIVHKVHISACNCYCFAEAPIQEIEFRPGVIEEPPPPPPPPPPPEPPPGEGESEGEVESEDDDPIPSDTSVFVEIYYCYKPCEEEEEPVELFATFSAKSPQQKSQWLEQVKNCPHRSEEKTGDIKCKTCGNRDKMVPVFHCSYFEKEVTINPNSSGIDCCKKCELWLE
jgi:hypothetical protein